MSRPSSQDDVRGRVAVIMAYLIGGSILILSGAAAVDIWLSNGELSQTTAAVIGSAVTGSIGIVGTYLGASAAAGKFDGRDDSGN